jgi:hypothetical protein
VYRFEVAQGFRDDLAHLSDLTSPGIEAFWLVGPVASAKPDSIKAHFLKPFGKKTKGA